MYIGAITVDNGTVYSIGTLGVSMRYGMSSAGILRDGSVENIVITDIVGSKDTGQPDVGAGTVLYSFQIDTTGITDFITIDDWQGANPFGIPFPVGSSWNTAAIDIPAVTPEPMTLALLGLGGLIIRRKK